MSEGKVLSLVDLHKDKKAGGKRAPSKFDFKHGEREFVLLSEGCPDGLHLYYCLKVKVHVEGPEFLRETLEQMGAIEKMSQKPVRHAKVHRRWWNAAVPFRWRAIRTVNAMKRDLIKDCDGIDMYDKLAEEIENT